MLTAETLAELTAASMELPWLDEIRLSQGQVQSVTIIPSDDVSTEEKLMLTFASASRMPQRIPALLQAIAVALGCEQPITAIVHAGGARYTVLQADGRALAIPTKAMSVATYLRVLFLLKDISVTIQALFAVSTSNASE
jgi:hypothetical protein